MGRSRRGGQGAQWQHLEALPEEFEIPARLCHPPRTTVFHENLIRLLRTMEAAGIVTDLRVSVKITYISNRYRRLSPGKYAVGPAPLLHFGEKRFHSLALRPFKGCQLVSVDLANNMLPAWAGRASWNPVLKIACWLRARRGQISDRTAAVS